jgi:molecular chaperone GrpE (heat shock protein)
MQKNEHTRETLALLQKHLQVQPNEPLAIPAEEMEELRRLLRKQINYLIDYNFERLLQAMYRMDVHESAFKAALKQPTGPAIVDQLTELVLEREKQKVITRRLYSNA